MNKALTLFDNFMEKNIEIAEIRYNLFLPITKNIHLSNDLVG